MSTTQADRKLWAEHFNRLKTRSLAELRLLSNFIASNSQLRESKSHRTQQIKAVSSEAWKAKLATCDTVYDLVKQMQKDAVLVGFDQKRPTFQSVSKFRKECKSLLTPASEEMAAGIAANWPNDSRESLLKTMVAVADQMRNAMKNLNDALAKWRVDLTPHLTSKEFTQRLADPAVAERTAEIKTEAAEVAAAKAASAANKATKKRKPAEIDDEAEEDEDEGEDDDESGEDLGDEDTIDGEDVEEQRISSSTKKALTKIAYVDNELSVESETADSDDACTSTESSDDDASKEKEPRVVRRILPKRKSEQLAVLLREQMAADAAYQEDFKRREKLIDAVKAAIERDSKKSIDEDESEDGALADDEKETVEVVVPDDDDEDDEDSAYDYKKDRKAAKKERAIKRRRTEAQNVVTDTTTTTTIASTAEASTATNVVNSAATIADDKETEPKPDANDLDF